jgi:hypothetical protein
MTAIAIFRAAMSDDEYLAPAVLQFLGLCIPTVPHLEALLLIWETAPRAWAAREISARIYVADDAASTILEDLERCSVVERDGPQSLSFRYNPRNDWDSTLSLVSQSYRRQLSRVARYIHSKGREPVCELSRASKLRKEP